MTTILHIDQDEAVQQFFQAALSKDYNLISAADGPMAVQYCAMIQPDLIIMSLSLPDIEGLELASRLKMFMPQTPIVVVADDHLDHENVSTAKAETDGFIGKPVNVEKLHQLIRTLLPPPVELPAFTSSLPAKAVRQFESQIEALNQANNRLASLNAISALIGTSLNLEHLMDEILAQIHRTVDFDSATLLLVKGEILEAAASRGFTTYRRGMNVYTKSDHNSAWRVVSHKLPLIIKDVREIPFWEPRPELNQIRSWLGVPLIYKDRVVGVLTLDKNEPDAFTDADARYVFTLAYQTAIAVENAQLFEEWEDQSTRLKLINEVTQEINTLLDVDHLFEALAKAIYERLDYDRVAILEVDETRSILTLKAVYGENMVEPKTKIYKQAVNDEGPIGKAIHSGRSVLVSDMSQLGGLLPVDRSEVRSVLAIPIYVSTQVEAVLIVERDSDDSFADQDLWTLSSLVNQAATAIKNAWLYRSLDAYSDKLERTIEARTQRLQAIKKMSQVVSQGLEIDELLAVVGEGIGQIFIPEPAAGSLVTVGLVDGSQVWLRKIYEVDETGRSHNDQAAGAASTGMAAQDASYGKFTISPDNLTGQVIIQAKPKILNELPAQNMHPLAPDQARIVNSVLMTPLITGGKTIGLIIVESQIADAFDDSDLETLETLAFQIASAIEHARLLKKTREIAIVEERTRLARDMHDGVAQNLAYLLIQVDRCLNRVEEEGELEKQLMQISSLLKQNIDELRRNIFDLRPVDLEGRSFFRVLDNFVTEFGQRWKLKTTCTMTGQSPEVDPELESSLYRILQEALSNARQHARCTELAVEVMVKDGQWLTLEVEDNGQGFDASEIGHNRPPGQRTGLGLISMRERAESIGGKLIVESSGGQGTRIFARLPLDARAADGDGDN